MFPRFLFKLTLLVALLAAGVSTAAHAQGTTSNCPNAPVSRLVAGRPAHVTPGAANNMRDKASKSGAVVMQIPGDSYVDVLDGPVCADGYAWWHISLGGGQDGWMAEGSGKTYFVEPATSPITAFTMKDTDKSIEVQYQTVSFTYNGAVGKTVEADTVFAVSASQDNPFQYAAPQFIDFRFPEKANPDQPYLEPELSFYPADEYVKVNDQAKTQIANLKALLKTQGEPPKEGIPVLPPVNAGQVFHSQVSYLQFAKGTGVRFLTAYAQGIIPITSDQLRYQFQGLTSDGKYLVTLSFPISSHLLPATYNDVKGFDDLISGDNAGDKYMTYIKTTVDTLNRAQSADFEPSLADLDALIQSITVK